MEDKKAKRRKKRFTRTRSFFRCFGGDGADAGHRPVPLESARSGGVSDDGGSVSSTASSTLSASSSVSSRVSVASDRQGEFCGGAGAGEEPPRASSADEASSVRKRRQLAKKLLGKIARSAAFVKALQQAKRNRTVASGSPPRAEDADGSSHPGRCSSPNYSVCSTASSLHQRLVQQPPLPQPPAPRSVATSFGFLVLLSLAVMLFWGRACAILWTSTCLVLAPRRGIGAFAEASSPVDPARGARDKDKALPAGVVVAAGAAD